MAELSAKAQRSRGAQIAGQASGRLRAAGKRLADEREAHAAMREKWTDAERRAWLVEAHRTGELRRVARTAGEARALEIEARELLPF